MGGIIADMPVAPQEATEGLRGYMMLVYQVSHVFSLALRVRVDVEAKMRYKCLPPI